MVLLINDEQNCPGGEGLLSGPREQEFHILDILSEESTPVGAGAIRQALDDRGLTLSEATVGRVLRELDHRGYTKKSGFQGRSLSPEGASRLEALREERGHTLSARVLLDELKSQGIEKILDVLVARRAIERETARLAARMATAEEIERLRNLVAQQENALRKKESVAPFDAAFHREIARISRNAILAAAVDLIRQDVKLGPAFEYARKKAASTLGSDHKAIIEALAAHDEDGAERAMVMHVENTLRDVQRYLDQNPELKGDPAA
jgi:GntR family L-lactate dehydrogenase operon transcriptional regulator